MTAFSSRLPASLLRAVLALAVLAGLLLGMAHPPAQPQAITHAAQTASLELGGGTFGPSGHVLAEDFRQPQHRPGETSAPDDGDEAQLSATVPPATPLPAAARLSAATTHRPAGQTADAHRPTGPPRLLS